MQIELELVNHQADAISLEVAHGMPTGAIWDISGIQCKCDSLELVRRSPTDMRVICFQVKVSQIISIPGII